MAATPKELYEKAMSLSDEERVELVGLLLETLEVGDERGVEAAWLKEIEKRVAELDSGAAKSIPWTQVRARVFETGAR
jgi:putative addiction module component (TIGR02574 family)